MKNFTETRLEKQIDFMREIDKLKDIFRQTYLLSQTRQENSAEHSWHVALMAIIFAEHANANINVLTVIKMLLIHDIVEIDAGDVLFYDTEKRAQQEEIEKAAAKRIFSLLPESQAEEFLALWHEFEEAKTEEAKFAKAIDRLLPVLHNYYGNGTGWKAHAIKLDQVLGIEPIINKGTAAMWPHLEQLILDAHNKGFLK
jgi:putative hydrolase of HD superfamily